MLSTSLQAERNKLKDMNEKQLKETDEYLELLDDANKSVLALKEDLKATQDALKASEQKLNGLEVEASKEVGRLRGELAAVTRDRDAMIAVIDQQEVALKLQNRQSEAGELRGIKRVVDKYMKMIIRGDNDFD